MHNLSINEALNSKVYKEINYESFVFLDSPDIGSFDDASDWTLDTGWTISNPGSGNQANYVDPGGPVSGRDIESSSASVMSIGNEYTITFDIVSFVSGSIRIEGMKPEVISFSSTGTHTATFIAITTKLKFTSVSGGRLSIDNVSVKEAPSDHVATYITSANPAKKISLDKIAGWEGVGAIGYEDDDVIEIMLNGEYSANKRIAIEVSDLPFVIEGMLITQLDLTMHYGSHGYDNDSSVDTFDLHSYH